MRQNLAAAYVGLAGLFVLGVVVQVFFAGLGIFGAKSFQLHEDFGYLLHLMPMLMLVFAVIGPRTRWHILNALGLFVVVTAQIGLIETREDAPGLAALHPVLAVAALGWAVWILVRNASHTPNVAQ